MANRSVNKVILIGHLGRDAETKFTASGVSVSQFTLATNRRIKDAQTGEWKDETDWHRVVVWRQENLAQYLTKGKQVYVEGRLQTRSWEDQNGQKRYTTEVIAEEVFLLGGRTEGAGDESFSAAAQQRGPVSMPRQTKPAQAGAQQASGGDFDPGPPPPEDDVPF
ncbi:MAG: single-stranded DNA-binding protein [Bryobacteraceae bacterium]|jgi:single-strand DNA-binding protein|nr:single-stranded DNA-binding protein [Bryobacteraceae bacterium]